MKDLKYEHQSTFSLWGRAKLNFRDRYRKPNIYSKNSSCYQVFSSNSQKLSLWCKKKNHYPPRWICMTHIKAPTLFLRAIIIFQGLLTKFHFSTKFPHLEKIVNLIKDLKYKHQSTFPLWGRAKLNFRDWYRKLNIFCKNSSCYEAFHQILKNFHFGVKKKSLPYQMDLYDPYKSPNTIP